MRDTRPETAVWTGYEVAQVARLWSAFPGRWMLLILDTCFSGDALGDLTAVASRAARKLGQEATGKGFAIIAVARANAKAAPRAFADALIAAVDDEAFGGLSLPVLPLDAVVQEVNARFERSGLAQRAQRAAGPVEGYLPFFPNPRFISGVAEGLSLAEQVELQATRSYFETKSRAVSSPFQSAISSPGV